MTDFPKRPDKPLRQTFSITSDDAFERRVRNACTRNDVKIAVFFRTVVTEWLDANGF